MEQNDTKPNHLERLGAGFKNIPSKSAFFAPMISRPAEAPTKTEAETHPKPSSKHVEIASLACRTHVDDISVQVSQCFNQRFPERIFWAGGMRVSVFGLTPFKPTLRRSGGQFTPFKQTFPRVAVSRGKFTPFKPTFPRVAASRE